MYCSSRIPRTTTSSVPESGNAFRISRAGETETRTDLERCIRSSRDQAWPHAHRRSTIRNSGWTSLALPSGRNRQRCVHCEFRRLFERHLVSRVNESSVNSRVKNRVPNSKSAAIRRFVTQGRSRLLLGREVSVELCRSPGSIV